MTAHQLFLIVCMYSPIVKIRNAFCFYLYNHLISGTLTVFGIFCPQPQEPEKSSSTSATDKVWPQITLHFV